MDLRSPHCEIECKIFNSKFYCNFVFQSQRSGNLTTYSVAVSDTTATFKVEAVFTDMLEPYPAEITQNEVRACTLNCVILSHARVTAYPETQLFLDSV